MKPIPLVVPKETVSDDRYLYVESQKKDGEMVRTGELVAILESSKSTFGIHSPADGFIFSNKMPGTHVEVGDILAWINAVAERPIELDITQQKTLSVGASGVAEQRISKAALALIDKNHLSFESFKHLKTVSRDDVLTVLAGKSPTPNGNEKTSGNRMFILGGGGHAKMCIDLLRMAGAWEIVGILDSKLPVGSTILGVPVLDRDVDAAFRQLWDDGVRFAVNGIGWVERHRMRHLHYDRLKSFGFYLPNLIHPHASVEASVIIGEGNQVMARAVICSAARIGNGCIINAGAIVSHDCQISDQVHIAPGALLAGGVSVGSNTLIGMGCTIYLRVHIGSNVVVANGTNIHQNLVDNEVLHT